MKVKRPYSPKVKLKATGKNYMVLSLLTITRPVNLEQILCHNYFTAKCLILWMLCQQKRIRDLGILTTNCHFDIMRGDVWELSDLINRNKSVKSKQNCLKKPLICPREN